MTFVTFKNKNKGLFFGVRDVCDVCDVCAISLCSLTIILGVFLQAHPHGDLMSLLESMSTKFNSVS